ncbi:MAG: SsrA-binding protein, partial [Bacteroidetes bacterium]|nr:SsrA-binding protein [Bacteroidota bacterium]
MSEQTIATNRKARHHFEVVDTYVAGMQLQGTEVKSLRNGKVSFGDAFCYIDNDEVYLKSLHISEYKQGNLFNHAPRRLRKLLLKKMEI